PRRMSAFSPGSSRCSVHRRPPRPTHSSRWTTYRRRKSTRWPGASRPSHRPADALRLWPGDPPVYCAAMKHTVVLIPGDGIGPEVTRAVKKILAAAGADIEWIERTAGV